VGPLQASTLGPLQMSTPKLQARLVVLDLREFESWTLAAFTRSSTRAFALSETDADWFSCPPPSVHRMFALTRSSDEVEIAALDLIQPAVQMLQQSHEEDLAS